MNRQRYTDYYLVNDEDMDNVDDNVEFSSEKRCTPKKVVCITSVCLLTVALVTFFLTFVGFPLAFKNIITLQESLVFTRWNLLNNKTVYANFRMTEYKNHYVQVLDLDNKTTLQLGLWHLLPLSIAQRAIYEENFDFDQSLRSSNFSVLLYFHGTGEDRTQSWMKYQMLRYYFHVIAFDYRGYGDSDQGTMLEPNILNDCLQVYNWLQNRTDSHIFFWGHSLGTALATGTIAKLGHTVNLTGLILEAPFTSLPEELYYHPYVKYFKWLPWFKSTIVNPLIENGFRLNNSQNILQVPVPVMLLHAKDDIIVPYFMSEQLYLTSQTRPVSSWVKNKTLMVLYDQTFGWNHYFIYRDPYTMFYVYEFLQRCTLNGSGQS